MKFLPDPGGDRLTSTRREEKEEKMTSARVAPVAADLQATVGSAVAQREQVESQAKSLVAEGVRTIWFVGCGGSLYVSGPAQFLLERRGRSIASFRMTASEFNYRRPALLGGESAVVVISHSGKTPETLDAIETARSLGAHRVVGITRSQDSPLARGADVAFTYDSEHTVWAPKQVLLAHLAHGLLAGAGEAETGADVASAYDALPGALLHAIDQQDKASHEAAASLKDEAIIYLLGSGPNEDAARCLSMCYLQEMQWLHASAFNAGEFFHGAFEVVTEETPLVVLLGEDETRPIAERALRFARSYSKKVFSIDSADLELPGLPRAARGEVAPIVLGVLVDRMAQHFESVTGHSLKLRRYMGQVAY
jgi:fructoselysine 6-phosphate deglycase